MSALQQLQLGDNKPSGEGQRVFSVRNSVDFLSWMNPASPTRGQICVGEIRPLELLFGNLS